MEVQIARWFDVRRNIVVPRVSWGLNLHECDLLILTKANHAIEVEIKVSLGDLKVDLQKDHGHRSDRIRRLFFAVPETMKPEKFLPFVPERAGVIVVHKAWCDILRPAKINTRARQFTMEERSKLAELGTMRYWKRRLSE